MTESLQNVADQMGDGGLSVRSGYPDEPEPPLRVAEEVGAAEGVGFVGVRHKNLAPAKIKAALADNGGGPQLEGLGGKVVPVVGEAADAEEDAPRGNLTGVGGDVRRFESGQGR